MAKTHAERQKEFADRQRAAGRTQRKIWAHNDDWPAIMDYVRGVNLLRDLVEEHTGQLPSDN